MLNNKFYKYFQEMKDNIIQVNNLRKNFSISVKQTWFANKIKSLFNPQYEEFEAVKDINFEVSKWEKIAFLGPNWAGKSTTIKMLTWILHQTEGEINILGMNPSKDRNKLVYHIWAVFGQISRLWYHLTAYDTFLLLGTMFDIPEDKLEQRISYLINSFEIQDIVNLPVRKLSLGQRMKCEIVASLIHSPQIVFLDEPTIGLDMISKQTLREIINKINETENTTIFLTSHDLKDIESICDRVIIINYWKILFDGSIERLRKEYIQIKTFHVKFAKEYDLSNLDCLDISTSQDWYTKMEISNNKEQVNNFFQKLVSNYEIEDISINDPDIEEIIRQFY